MPDPDDGRGRPRYPIRRPARGDADRAAPYAEEPDPPPAALLPPMPEEDIRAHNEMWSHPPR